MAPHGRDLGRHRRIQGSPPLRCDRREQHHRLLSRHVVNDEPELLELLDTTPFLADCEVEAGSQVADVPQKRGQHDARRVVRHRDPEASAGTYRVEVGRTQQVVQAGQGVFEGLCQCLGSRCARHAARSPHQQGVAEVRPQLRVGVTDGRLALVEPQCGAGDVLLGQQRMQGQQLVEVDPPQFIYGANNRDAQEAFP